MSSPVAAVKNPHKAGSSGLRFGVFLRGASVIAGGFLVHLSLGTLYTIGNLLPYVVSYTRARSHPENLAAATGTWVAALNISGQGLTMCLGGWLEKRVGPRLSTLAGGWLMSAGVLASFFTIKVSFWLFLLSYGLVFGLGIGIAYVGPLSCAMRWMPRYKGVAGGFVVAGFGLGALFFDQVQSLYNAMKGTHPLRVIRTPNFYHLWVMFLLAGFAVNFISTLYKVFGLSFIDDDQFLAIVGSTSSILNCAGRIVWGLIADRFSFKFSLVFQSAVMTIFLSTFYATIVLGKSAFFIWVCVIFFCVGGNFSLFPTAMALSFGPKYMSINYGLLFTSQVSSGVVAAVLFTTLQRLLDWDGTIFLATGISLAGFLVTLAFVFRRYY
jgi:MFS family permease